MKFINNQKQSLHTLFLILLLATLVGVGGGLTSCSDDDDSPATPSYLKTGKATVPANWVAPDYSLYELTMSVQVQLGDTLKDFQSSGDMMCATINDEVRAVTKPMVNGTITYYPLSIAGNGGDMKVSLHYYCDRLHRIYTITNWTQFNAAAAPTGESSIYRPCFTSGL